MVQHIIVKELEHEYNMSLKRHSYRQVTNISPQAAMEIPSNSSNSNHSTKLASLSTILPDISKGSDFRNIIPLLPPDGSKAMSQMLVNMVLNHFSIMLGVLNSQSSIFHEQGETFIPVEKRNRKRKRNSSSNDENGDDIMGTAPNTNTYCASSSSSSSSSSSLSSSSSSSSSSNIASDENLLINKGANSLFDNPFRHSGLLTWAELNMSSYEGAFNFPMEVIMKNHIGEGNEPLGGAFHEINRYLPVSQDGGPALNVSNVLLTSTEKLSENMQCFKALTEVMFTTMGPFHAENSVMKAILKLFSYVLAQAMTLYGRIGEGKHKFTESVGRTEKTLQHMFLILDGFIIGAMKSFIAEVNDIFTSSEESLTVLFGEWLATRNAQTRTLFMFMTYFEQYYGYHYAIKDMDFDLFINFMLLSMEFDISTGDHHYIVIKAYQILELLSKSDLWKEQAGTFLFAINVSGVGTGYDQLLEFIHRNVNQTLGQATPACTLSRRLNRVSCTLPSAMRAKAASSSSNTAGKHEMDESKILWPKKVDLEKAKKLADAFISKGLYGKDLGQTLTEEGDTEARTPVFSCLLFKKSLSFKLGTIFSDGSAKGPAFFSGYTDAWADGKMEARDLWRLLLKGDIRLSLPKSTAVLDADENLSMAMDEDEEEDGEVSVQIGSTSHDRPPPKDKANPNWKAKTDADNISNVFGVNKDLAKCESQIILAFECNCHGADFNEYVGKATASKGVLSQVTIDTWFMAMNYYQDILRKIIAAENSTISEGSNFTKDEEELFKNSDRFNKNKTNPSKVDTVTTYFNLRRLVDETVDKIICQAAIHDIVKRRTESVGSVQTHWEPWAQRIRVACDDAVLREEMEPKLVLFLGQYRTYKANLLIRKETLNLTQLGDMKYRRVKVKY